MQLAGNRASSLAIGHKALYSNKKEKYNARIASIRRVDSDFRGSRLGRTRSLPGGRK